MVGLYLLVRSLTVGYCNIRTCIMAIRKEGGCVSLKIILGAAIGILKATHPSALKVNGGPLSLTKHWAKSFATRHKLVK